MRTLITISVLVSLFVAGCKFDDLDQKPLKPAAPVAAKQPQAAEPAKPREVRAVSTVKLGIATQAGERPLKKLLYQKDQLTYFLKDRITLPAVLPEAITLQIPLPVAPSKDVRQETFTASFSKANERVGNETNIENHSFDAATGLSTFNIRIDRLREFISSEALENKIDLSISRVKEKKPFAVIALNFATLPAVEIKAFPLSDAKLKGDEQIEQLKRLETSVLRLDLAYVVSVTNRSTVRTELRLPLKPKGKLLASFSEASVGQGQCIYSSSRRNWDDLLTDEVTLLPIEDDLPNKFTAFIDKYALANEYLLELDPGSERVVGIYVSGGKAKELFRDGYKRKEFSPVRVVSGCKSRCPIPNITINFYYQYWSAKGWPGASKVCYDVGCRKAAPPPGDEGACNSCAAWDESSGGEMRYCPIGWERELSYATVDSGTKTNGISLRTDEEILIKVRASGLTIEEDPEQRFVPIISRSTTIFE